MKLKQETINSIKGLHKPFSLEGAAEATGKHYLTVRKYIQAMTGKEIKLVEHRKTGKRGKPIPLYGLARIKGRFAKHGREAILSSKQKELVK